MLHTQTIKEVKQLILWPVGPHSTGYKISCFTSVSLFVYICKITVCCSKTGLPRKFTLCFVLSNCPIKKSVLSEPFACFNPLCFENSSSHLCFRVFWGTVFLFLHSFPSYFHLSLGSFFSHPHFLLLLLLLLVHAGFPSRRGDVVAYVKVINQPSLPTQSYSVIVSISVFMALSTVFHSNNSPDDSPISHSVLPVISALLVLSALCIFMKVSFSLDIILCGWLGLKHQLTN